MHIRKDIIIYHNRFRIAGGHQQTRSRADKELDTLAEDPRPNVRHALDDRGGRSRDR